jgi:hypothetical protein
VSSSSNLARSAATFAIALLCLLAFTASAAAKPRGVVHTDIGAVMQLRGTQNYKISLSIILGHLELGTYNGPLSVSYSGKARIHGNHFAVRLGKLGHISLKFENPEGHRRTYREDFRHCGGIREVAEFGVFKGSFVFRGDQDYTEVSTHRVKGLLTHYSERICGSQRKSDASRAPSEPKPAPAASRLEKRLRSRTGAGHVEIEGVGATDGNLVFDAIRAGGSRGPWEINAELSERRGRLEIHRSALVEKADPDSIVLADDSVRPATASIAPPKPFLGTAAYTDAPAPGALPWDGSLSVSLPGLGAVPLAGRDFSAIVCHTQGVFAKFSHCIETGLLIP